MNSKTDDIQVFKDELLTQLQCPFKWNEDNIIINKIAVNRERLSEQDRADGQDEFFPLIKIIRLIYEVYMSSNNKRDDEEILRNFEKCEDALTALRERADPEISINVVMHIVKATEYFVYQQLKLPIDDSERALKNIQLKDISNKKENSTLLACKSMFWLKYDVGYEKSEEYIREALKENSKNSLWHFTLGKILRHKRRDIFNSRLDATPDEVQSFFEAYNMDQNPFYGIFLAQAYRESPKNRHLALGIYKEVLRSKPESSSTLLRLAKVFTTLGEFEEAKECFDEAEKRSPLKSMFCHYKGIYHFKQRQYHDALPYFEEAVRGNNLYAEMHYVNCMLKIYPHYDALNYLINLLDKYKQLPEKQIQSIYLDIAFLYWKEKYNFKEALEYFLLTIEIDPEAKFLTGKYRPGVAYWRWTDKNEDVYRILEKDFFYWVRRHCGGIEFMVEKIKKLEKYCEIYQI